MLPGMAACAQPQDYDSLIRRARNGDYQPALSMLVQRLQHTQDNRRALADYLLISDWAGHSQAIVQAYEQAGSPNNLPPQALGAVARAYRDTHRWGEALALYSSAEHRYPGQAAFTYGYVMTLADAGRTAAAVQQGTRLVAAHADSADSHLALSYAYQRAGQPYAALAQASWAYDLAPHKPYVIRAYILAQQEAQLPRAALSMAQAHPGILQAAQTRSLQADAAAQLTRAAATESRGGANRYALADQALATYDRLIPEWKALGPAARADVERIEADRLQALAARHRMAELVASYEAMQAAGQKVPSYVLSDVATAYLSMHRPEIATRLFRQATEPGKGRDAMPSMEERTGLFYALTESGQTEAANTELDQALRQQPTWVYHKGDPLRNANSAKLDAALTRALGTLYEGQTLQAQAELNNMVSLAPGNTGLRTARSQAYRARALPRLAERDLKIAETQAPRSIDVEVNQAETALALQEWRQAKLLRDDLVARAPENSSVQRLAREWQVHDMAELRVTASRGVSTNNPALGSRDWNLDSVLYTPPIAENWRAFAGAGYSEGEFEEGKGYYGWTRAGVEWRGRDLTAQAEISGNRYGHGTRTGAAITAAVDLDDHWQIGAGAALLSRDTPLRALKHDITSNSLNASLRWRGDERREWTLRVVPSFFSDGNNRLELGLNGRQRLYTSPKVQVDALLDLSASHNTADDAVYFNPKSDLTILPALQITHTLYQRYEQRWDQQFLAAAGTYTQQHHGTGGIYTLGYGQRYQFNDVLDVGFMVSATSRPYDGQRERDFNFTVNMTYRF